MQIEFNARQMAVQLFHYKAEGEHMPPFDQKH